LKVGSEARIKKESFRILILNTSETRTQSTELFIAFRVPKE